ncbi:CLASP1 (predicted) [Pycnogonum litorale]
MALSLDAFIPNIGVLDTKKKIQIGQDILDRFKSTGDELECEEVAVFIDGMISWINLSNFKVVMNGLEILHHVVLKMREDFKPYLSSVIPSTVDRLSDSKESVRELAQMLLLDLMEYVTTPQHVYDRLMPAFNHKNWKVREETMSCLQKTLTRFGAHSLSLSKIVPLLVKLLGDSQAVVRDTAVMTIVEVYKHVGEKVRHDLSKKSNIPAAKLSMLLAKFDEVKISGGLLPTAVNDFACKGDDHDGRSVATSLGKSMVKRASSAPPTRRSVFVPPKAPMSNNTAAAGSIDEETFIRAFEDVPRIQFFSARELESEINKIKDMLSNCTDWEKRADAMKRVRSLIIAGASDYDELPNHLRSLEHDFQSAICDLRSQVVREACIAIAYLCVQLHSKVYHFCETLLPYLIQLIPNSAKVMSSSGTVTIRFIVEHTHSSKLIPIITSNVSSKSKEIRKAMCETLDQLLHTWSKHQLERHIALLQDAIKRGISDADQDARVSARKAFWGFAGHFKDQADNLLTSLDVSKQKILQGEMSMSNSSSSNSLNTIGRRGTNLRSSLRSTGIPTLSSPKIDKGHTVSPYRSNSAIDMNALRRVKAVRASSGIMNAARLPRGSVASLPRPKKSETVMTTSVISPDRTTRSRSRVTQSQPSSRSGSPSRLGSSNYGHSRIDGRGVGSHTPSYPRHRSGIPRSTSNSREASPNRGVYSTYGGGARDRRYSGGSGRRSSFSERNRDKITPTRTTPVMAEKILMQSQEAEAAMADALVSCAPLGQRSYDPSFNDHSDESETSSICSERSYNSYHGRSTDDVAEILRNCSSTHWSDRKEGLLGLKNLFHSRRMLNPHELKRVTDLLTRMFMDPNNKIFNLFLDVLNDMIIVHKHELHHWVHALLTRLINKIGMDPVPSILSKLFKTTDIIRDSFPYDLQFTCAMRYLGDQTQTPNVKAKAAILNYLRVILELMEPSEFHVGGDTVHAVIKIICWTMDNKNADIRRAAQLVIIALFSLNTAGFSQMLSTMSKTYQDNAFKLLSMQLRRGSSDPCNGSMSMTPPSPISPHLQSPNSSSSSPRYRIPVNKTLEYDDTENLNPEDVHRSLKKTSAEIQSYSFDGFEHALKDNQQKILERDSLSLDSGISQISVPDARLDTLDEQCEKLHQSTTINARFAYNFPSPPILQSNQFGTDGYDRNLLAGELSKMKQAGTISIDNIITTLGYHNTMNKERKVALEQLDVMTRDESVWEDNFRIILRLLIETVGDKEPSIRAQALKSLCQLLKKQSQRFQSYIELTLLKILEAHKDTEKEVLRSAEVCSATAASILPPDQSIQTLMPIIMTGDYPVNQAAIKMLTKIIENHTQSIIVPFLPDMMPGLIRAYDNQESSVRKAAVFCMVAIHNCVGEEMKSHLGELNGSKMKLLNLYIKRAQSLASNDTSPTSSPKNTSK